MSAIFYNSFSDTASAYICRIRQLILNIVDHVLDVLAPFREAVRQAVRNFTGCTERKVMAPFCLVDNPLMKLFIRNKITPLQQKLRNF